MTDTNLLSIVFIGGLVLVIIYIASGYVHNWKVVFFGMGFGVFLFGLVYYLTT
jgi:hypothetical protein